MEPSPQKDLSPQPSSDENNKILTELKKQGVPKLRPPVEASSEEEVVITKSEFKPWEWKKKTFDINDLKSALK